MYFTCLFNDKSHEGSITVDLHGNKTTKRRNGPGDRSRFHPLLGVSLVQIRQLQVTGTGADHAITTLDIHDHSRSIRRLDTQFKLPTDTLKEDDLSTKSLKEQCVWDHIRIPGASSCGKGIGRMQNTMNVEPHHERRAPSCTWSPIMDVESQMSSEFS